MPMKPKPGESQSEFTSRCIPDMMGKHGGTVRPQEQAVAACLNIWRTNKGKPAKSLMKLLKDYSDMNGEAYDYETFFEECMDILDDEEACDIIWNSWSVRRSRRPMSARAKISITC